MASVHHNQVAPDEVVPVAAITAAPDIEMAPMHPAPAAKDSDLDPFLVAFEEPFDAANPKNWPTSRKWAMTDVLSATGFNRIMVSTIMAPALSLIATELHMNSAESVMALSIYLLATAFGPLVMGPLSEIYGRKTVLHVSNVWFLVWNIACGFATTKELLIATRFLAGFGASSIYALAGGVLGDVWRPEQRGRSLGTYLLIPLLGAAVGPIIGGFMAGRTTWRWLFWSTSIFQAVMILVSFTTFCETHAPTILQRRAEKLRRETGNQQYYTIHERFDGNKSLAQVIQRALTRPLRLLAFHPIIQVSSVISAFNYGILYIILSSFADLWTQHYHQSVEISGLHYIACALGEIAGSQLGGPLMDVLFRRLKAHAKGEHTPEFRIPLIFPGALLGPLGLFIYAWTAEYRVHWIAVDIGIFITMFGGQITSMPMQAYVIDAYPDHTSSAIAAVQFMKSLTAFLFPLFVPAMYNALGYGWGSSTLAFAGLLIGLPAPLIVWLYGAKLRAKAASSY
ncbi:putative efflux pump antibiotic resistance protein [Pseudomassariella vexata]|uniref:Putative efflux pump antibiotic resistance protein n=1 Tax=Pseudomassariella vexata TaxID=1141098 RepID=A0A1Y2DTJ6_9PEZI|nr:putative efflux pump antibiotic resistance protein [Pseudomassariella vexata]ORY62601.1 putative efflux pump antibiotic resistance protein [Pseudomassariella vexata]